MLDATQNQLLLELGEPDARVVRDDYPVGVGSARRGDPAGRINASRF